MDEFEEKSLWVKGRFGGREGGGQGFTAKPFRKFDEVDK